MNKQTALIRKDITFWALLILSDLSVARGNLAWAGVLVLLACAMWVIAWQIERATT